tara:strand:+ start:42 stop:164 length:123 start_codon:yes stop_codon:yes gene_type:complete
MRIRTILKMAFPIALISSGKFLTAAAKNASSAKAGTVFLS